ncbi:MAG TPA: pirin family protein [Cyclobacteriaceae bacterium]|nr:pirin family protein [Cyclobacteriaceae bacterium]
MKTILHKAADRGHASHGWLDSHHSFSFAHFYDPDKIHFGALRVLNDDIVQGGMGFGTHPHDNMEIISIPLSGDLEHKDSMGNTGVIRQNDVQIMSAGSGIQHSEYNMNKDKLVNFLQIWVFPKVKNITPRYDQKTLRGEDRLNKLQVIVSPDSTTAGESGVKINQEAWFNLGTLSKGTDVSYPLHDAAHGVYVFVIEGDVTVNGQALNKRDALGVWDTEKLSLTADSNAEVLLMEVPMN